MEKRNKTMPVEEQEVWSDVVALLRSTLSSGGTDDAVWSRERERWECIFASSCPHHLTALLYDAVREVVPAGRVPRETLLKFGVVTDRIETDYARKRRVVAELARFYKAHGMTMMLLKGIGLGAYYPVPSHRSSSDVDIFLYGATRRADRLMARELGIAVSDDVHHHTTFKYKGVLVENHYDFVNTHDHRSARRLEEVLKRLAAVPGRSAEVEGETVLLPSADFNALFLMRHMAAHYAAERVSLRHLCDWMLFLVHEHAGIDFVKMEEYYRRFNLHRFANAVNGILVERFRMDPALLPPFERERELEERIFNDIVSPEFRMKRPASGTVRILGWKMRRFAANRWKHEIVYNEPWFVTFFQSAFSHLIKPKTIKG
jgi:hypothetical protein